MNEYVYRINTQSGLEKIQDNHFRGRRWLSGVNGGYPHALLKREHATLSITEGLFLVCFYSNHAKAEQSLNSDFSYLGQSYMLRCPKEHVVAAGFNESWDDGFKEGDAYLFWNKENISDRNANFSSAGIPLEVFEIWKDSKWQPLHQYFGGNVQAPTSNKVSNSGMNRSSAAQTDKPWWKIW